MNVSYFQMKEPLITSSFLLKLLKIPSSELSGQMFETTFNKLVGPHVLLEKRLAETDKNVKPLSTQTKLSKVRHELSKFSKSSKFTAPPAPELLGRHIYVTLSHFIFRLILHVPFTYEDVHEDCKRARE